MNELMPLVSVLVMLMLILGLVSVIPHLTQTAQTAVQVGGSSEPELRITLEGDSVIDALNSEGSYAVYLKQGYLGIPYETVDVFIDGIKYAGIKTDGTGKATFSLKGSMLGIGTHNLTVSYSNVSDSMTVAVEPYAYITIYFLAQTDPIDDPNSHISQVELYLDNTRILIYQFLGNAYSATRQVRVSVNENHTIRAVVKGYGNVTARITVELESSYTMRNGYATLDETNNYTMEVSLGIRVDEDLNLSWWYP